MRHGPVICHGLLRRREQVRSDALSSNSLYPIRCGTFRELVGKGRELTGPDVVHGMGLHERRLVLTTPADLHAGYRLAYLIVAAKIAQRTFQPVCADARVNHIRSM